MIGVLIKRVPLGLWLALAAVSALGAYHWHAVREARREARAELKADIDAAAAKVGQKADAATARVLACEGTWNRKAGRCDL